MREAQTGGEKKLPLSQKSNRFLPAPLTRGALGTAAPGVFRYTKKAPPMQAVLFWYNRVCKPGSVLTAIYLDPQLLTGSSRLLGTVGPTYAFLHGVAPG